MYKCCCHVTLSSLIKSLFSDSECGSKCIKNFNNAMNTFKRVNSLKDLDYIDLSDGTNLNSEYVLSDGSDDVEIVQTTFKEQKKLSRKYHCNDNFNVIENLKILVNTNFLKFNEEPLYIDDYLVKFLKPHQIGGVRFLYDSVIGKIQNVRDVKTNGAILGHNMGLGKTLTSLTFIEIFLRKLGSNSLIIVPVNTFYNWVTEIKRWLPHFIIIDNYKNSIYELGLLNKKKKDNVYYVFVLGDLYCFRKEKTEYLEYFKVWKRHGGIILAGYETIRRYMRSDFRKKLAINCKKKKYSFLLEKIEIYIKMQKCLDKCDLVVYDEGHRIKNCKSIISKALNRINTRNRIILTGYPIQNNLIEYYYMVQHVRPDILGHKKRFVEYFSNPIKLGMTSDATYSDKIIMKYRIHVLYSLLRRVVQRRDQSILLQTIPPKQEFIIMLNMTKIQKDLYKLYINQFLKYEGVSDNGKMSGINVLVSFAHLSKIWNHPKILVDCVTEPDVDINDFDDLSVKHDPKQQKKSKKAKSYKSDISGLLWSKSFIENDLKDEHMFQLLHSPKFVFAISLIDEALKLNEKIVLFSMSLMTLNLFEKFLHKRKTNGEYWKKGVSYYRMDGSTHLNERHSIVKSYNDPENKVPLCLLSTKAVCLGINLVAASRAIIMDVNWNPCMDRQALFRIYRYGQNKPVSIYRLISFGTMENRIYNRQIAKQEISERVVDENYPFSRCSYQDLSELLKYKEDTLNIPINPEFRIKDRLLSIVIRKNVEHMAMLPFEHDSLFIEQDVKLSKTEEKHAEMSYQVEMKKKGIAVSTPKIPLPSNQNLFPIVLSDDSLSNLESSDNCIDSDSSIEIL